MSLASPIRLRFHWTGLTIVRIVVAGYGRGALLVHEAAQPVECILLAVLGEPPRCPRAANHCQLSNLALLLLGLGWFRFGLAGCLHGQEFVFFNFTWGSFCWNFFSRCPQHTVQHEATHAG